MISRTHPALALVVALSLCAPLAAQSGGELQFCIHSEPKTFNPLLVEDESSETVRYLTGGVLIRINRKTQALEPELASSWKVSRDGRTISFVLREGIFFSDGTPFSADDVAYTMRELMDPNLHSPTGDAFRSSEGAVRVSVLAPNRVRVIFPAPVAGVERLFDQVAILSARSPKKEMATLGPFYVAEYKPGVDVLLRRNPNYWKHDSRGRRLPYLDSIRLDIQQNRDTELLRFRRGEVHLINSLDAEYFDRLAAQAPEAVRDSGPSMDSEQLWFNQVAAAPVPAYKKAWFRSREFRQAVSQSIQRMDLCRVVFGGHAVPAAGPVSPANRFWYNAALRPPAFDPSGALKLLQGVGFRFDGTTLWDSGGHAVEFSIITNAGNKSRERMAAMIQEDLSHIGMKVNIVTLDFSSLIERITQSFAYEACLLGLVNVDLDPNGVMNVWLSSAENHQWNPNQKTPATPWEAEIDRRMRAQASSTDATTRKKNFDQVQQIVAEQLPFIYLVYKNSLSAVSPSLANADPAVLRPQTFWNAESLYFSNVRAGGQP